MLQKSNFHAEQNFIKLYAKEDIIVNFCNKMPKFVKVFQKKAVIHNKCRYCNRNKKGVYHYGR